MRLINIQEALNISLAVTSYQSARLILIRSDGTSIDTRFKTFPRPMGIYADKQRLTLGTFNQVVEFRRTDLLLKKIKDGELDNIHKFSKKVLEKEQKDIEQLRQERQQELDDVKQSDALYVHRAALTTGMINIHDIAWGDEGLWVVNSTFSCLSTLSPNYSFIARWRPPFITDLTPEDRCHLNGMAIKDGKPRYVTTFNKENSRDSWSEAPKHDGTLIDIDTNKIVVEGMILPHSPRYYKGFVYVCESGTGEIHRIDPGTREKISIIKLQGFTRGLLFYKGLMIVGTSRVRSSNIKSPIPLSKEYTETFAGIWIISLDDSRVVAHIKFNGDIDQLYDIAAIPNASYPELLSVNSSLTRHLFDFSEVRI